MQRSDTATGEAHAPGLGLAPRLDVLSADFARRRTAAFAKLRAAGPLARGGPATWAVSRHVDVLALLEDRRLGHGGPTEVTARFGPNALSGGGGATLRRVVSSLDPPDHGRVRRLMMKALSRCAAAALSTQFQATFDGLLAAALTRGRFDATTDIALPLQVAVTCRLVGVPMQDREAVMEQATRLGRAVILAPLHSEHYGDGAAEARWLVEYVQRLMAQRLASPADDLLSYLLTVADAEGRLTESEVIDNAVFCLFAGFETAVQLVSGLFVALARFPEQHARLQRETPLLPAAVEEILRFESPLQWVSRVTRETVDVDGGTIRAGRLVLLLLASANRDERRFSNPDTIDISRTPNRHLAFGGGEHHCMSRSRIRAQGVLVLERLLARGVRLELREEPSLSEHPAVRFYTRAPLAATALRGSSC